MHRKATEFIVHMLGNSYGGAGKAAFREPRLYQIARFAQSYIFKWVQISLHKCAVLIYDSQSHDSLKATTFRSILAERPMPILVRSIIRRNHHDAQPLRVLPTNTNRNGFSVKERENQFQYKFAMFNQPGHSFQTKSMAFTELEEDTPPLTDHFCTQ